MDEYNLFRKFSDKGHNKNSKNSLDEKRDFSKNIYVDSDSTPAELDEWFNKIHNRTIRLLGHSIFLKLIKDKSSQILTLTNLAEMISRRILFDIAIEYSYMELILKSESNKNIIGELLIFNISNQKFTLNNSNVENLIKEYIEISEAGWAFQPLFPKPRLKDDDISLIAYREVVSRYLKDKSMSENKACTIVFDELYDKGLDKKFEDFITFKVSFRDWSNNVSNRISYLELIDFIIEKSKRKPSKKI